MSPPNLNLPEPDLGFTPPVSPTSPASFGLESFVCRSVPPIGANVELSQRLDDPPIPPPQPNIKSKTPDHSYSCPKFAKDISDRDKLIWTLRMKVKSLQNNRKKDRIKLELARNKIKKFESGDLPKGTKKKIVQEWLGQGTLSPTLITNLANQAENPKGKSNSIFYHFSSYFKSCFEFLLLNNRLKIQFLVEKV